MARYSHLATLGHPPALFSRNEWTGFPLLMVRAAMDAVHAAPEATQGLERARSLGGPAVENHVRAVARLAQRSAEHHYRHTARVAERADDPAPF